MFDEEIIFIDDTDDEVVNELQHPPWKVAIIDDESQVHDVTKMALGDYKFAGRPLEFLNAYSAAEGRELFKQHNDIAVCLLDVVMETETAGLDLVKDIRADNNEFTRIVLRTGQPGQAPEEEVISAYDINDYKEKTELTRTKLTTLMHSCLKTYEYIIKQEHTRQGLEKVLESTAKIFENPFIKDFATGVMMQIISLFEFGDSAIYARIDHAMAAYEKENNLHVISGIGDFEPDEADRTKRSLPDKLLSSVIEQTKKFQVYHDEHYFIASHLGKEKEHYLLALSGELGGFSELDFKLASVFCHNALIAFENISLNNEIEEAQWEMVYLLGGAVETRSKETGNHIKRVAELSELLALGIGMESKDAELIKWASPLHDVGKIAIPDAILNKPGKLNADEWEIMKTHAEEGYRMLCDSKKTVIQLASRIAHDHHEHWSGAGYPNGKKGEEISIEGRITAIADVFDALCSKRCYKEAWSHEETFNYMKNGSGAQFDPQLIDTLLASRDAVLSIYEKYQD